MLKLAIMRIAIVSNYRIGNETGVARVSENLCTHLAKNNEVLYVCLGAKYKYKKSKKGFDILQIPSAPIKQGYVAKLSPDVVYKILFDLDSFSPNIVHAQNVIFVSLITQVWAIKNHIPFIITFHSLPSEGINYIFPKLAKNKAASTINFKLTKSYLDNLLKNTDLVIALNESVKKSIISIKANVPIKKIRNGISLSNFYTLRIKKPQKEKAFTFLGSYMYRKNQEFLVKAFAYLPDNFHLNLYGNIKVNRQYVKKLRKIMKKGNIRNVRINGFISRKGVSRALEKTDYFVSASLKEVQSLVIVEALASGTPVIGLANETINEIIDGNNGMALSQSTNPENFAEKLIVYVEKNEGHYVVNANYCRESIERFDIDNVVKNLLQVYKKTAKAKDKKKLKVGQSQLLEFIPKQVKKYFLPVFSKPKKPKVAKIRLLIFLTMLLSVIFYPVLKFISFVKTEAIEKTK